ncbi:hypothetical protein Drorol1_Dr00014420 [Drosera rotundifolia]
MKLQVVQWRASEKERNVVAVAVEVEREGVVEVWCRGSEIGSGRGRGNGDNDGGFETGELREECGSGGGVSERERVVGCRDGEIGSDRGRGDDDNDGGFEIGELEDECGGGGDGSGEGGGGGSGLSRGEVVEVLVAWW